MGPEEYDRSNTFLAGVRTSALLERHLDVRGLPDGVSTKILSQSADGSVSQVVTAPGGWTAGGARSFSALTEVFVLDGAMTVDDQTLRGYSYLRVPAGTTVSNIEAGDSGCRFLMFSTGLLEMIPATGANGPAGLEPLSLHEMSWVASTTPGVTPGLLHKRLAEDPDTGARTWIIGLIHWGAEISKWETHPCAEEVYFLEGAMQNGEVFPDGTRMIPYEAGGYFYRPAEIGHSGPGSGTDTYVIGLCRSSSAMAVDWHDAPPAFPDGFDAIDFG
ncbi:MAG: DUF4437 domain-containing protein [bacterium]|nr:DUF4437 domain-containing protein [bacterium]MDE0289742.1 DUF4437 domain-containing protein [bacterium]MDE0439819.1 DUF4437 domain-containing protein [bacterium]